jgi:hypothetical protein
VLRGEHFEIELLVLNLVAAEVLRVGSGRERETGDEEHQSNSPNIHVRDSPGAAGA